MHYTAMLAYSIISMIFTQQTSINHTVPWVPHPKYMWPTSKHPKLPSPLAHIGATKEASVSFSQQQEVRGLRLLVPGKGKDK